MINWRLHGDCFILINNFNHHFSKKQRRWLPPLPQPSHSPDKVLLDLTDVNVKVCFWEIGLDESRFFLDQMEIIELRVQRYPHGYFLVRVTTNKHSKVDFVSWLHEFLIVLSHSWSATAKFQLSAPQEKLPNNTDVDTLRMVWAKQSRSHLNSS